MAQVDKIYHDLLNDILENGVKKETRNGKTLSVFGRQIRFDLTNNKLPIITTKKIHTKGVIEELFWFLRGETNIKPLVDKGVNIWVGDAYKNYCKHTSTNSSEWNEWMRDNGDGSLSMYTEQEFIEKIKTDNEFAKKWGELGPVYGKQWRQWQGWLPLAGTDKKGSLWYDQIAILINDLRINPDSRRLMVNAWNVADLQNMILPPCHYGFQCWTRELEREERINWILTNCYETGMEKGIAMQWTDDVINSPRFNCPKRALTLAWNQRSVDFGLGLPFNITSYSILAHILAQEANMIAEELIGNLGDTHVYVSHLNKLKEQSIRDINKYGDSYIKIADNTTIHEYSPGKKMTPDDIEIIRYESYPAIKMPLSN